MANYSANENKKVSIIVPVYNAEKYLTKCLESLVHQTYNDIEILCVNDASIDSSKSIIELYSKYDNRLMLIDLEKNCGPAKARNIALDKATGDYIMFVDSDDFIAENACEILVSVAIEKDADILVFGGHAFPDEYNAPDWIKQKLNSNQKDYLFFNPNILLYEQAARPFIWLHFIKQELFETEPKIRFNEQFTLGEDQIMQFSYFPRATKISFITDKLYNYRWYREDSQMYKFDKMPYTKFRTHIRLIEQIREDWQNSGYMDLYNGKFLSFAIEFLYYDLIRFRMDVRCNFAKEIINIFNKVNSSIYLVEEEFRPKYEEILFLSQQNATFEDAIADEQFQSNQLKNEIQMLLHTKKYRIGKLFVSKKNRCI